LQFFHTAASTPPCVPLGTPRRRFFALCQIAAFSLTVLKYASYNFSALLRQQVDCLQSTTPSVPLGTRRRRFLVLRQITALHWTVFSLYDYTTPPGRLFFR